MENTSHRISVTLIRREYHTIYLFSLIKHPIHRRAHNTEPVFAILLYRDSSLQNHRYNNINVVINTIKTIIRVARVITLGDLLNIPRVAALKLVYILFEFIILSGHSYSMLQSLSRLHK